MLDPTVILACEHFAVIHKPAGMLSVPGKGEHKQDCAAARVRAMFPGASGPLVVHRLDMDTSGLLIFGLTPDAQRNLSSQFEQRTVSKAYIAAVDGVVAQDWGEINLPMRPDYNNRPWQMIDYVHGRPALTRYHVLARGPLRTLLRLEPVTGRAHQLRVHASIARHQGGLGAAIVGDVLYHPGSPWWDVNEQHARDRRAHALTPPLERLMLHASELSFNDPHTGARMECTCPEPQIAAAVLGG